jgi:hypothetical protein
LNAGESTLIVVGTARKTLSRPITRPLLLVPGGGVVVGSGSVLDVGDRFCVLTFRTLDDRVGDIPRARLALASRDRESNGCLCPVGVAMAEVGDDETVTLLFARNDRP